MKEYYGEILGNPKAVLVKCVDRCHNLTNMAWGLSRERITRMILETEEYYPKLLDVLKSSIEYNDAAWLLKYQIESMLDIYISAFCNLKKESVLKAAVCGTAVFLSDFTEIGLTWFSEWI